MSLATRATTAFFFVIVMVAGIFGGAISFSILFLLVTILCLWEFMGLMMSETSGFPIRKILGVALGAAPFLVFALHKNGLLPHPPYLALASTYLVAISSLFLFELFSKNERPFQDLAVIALGIFYIGLPFASLFFVAYCDGNTYSGFIVFGLILLSWANDTGAYLLGSKIGKTPLFPRISPKKTWEGSLSGVIVTFLAAYLLHYISGTLTLVDWLIFALIVALFGSLGDLVESMLKRSLKIKDSGNILPGHGGFLDRFDAFIFLLPFVAFYLLVLRHGSIIN